MRKGNAPLYARRPRARRAPRVKEEPPFVRNGLNEVRMPRHQDVHVHLARQSREGGERSGGDGLVSVEEANADWGVRQGMRDA